MLSFTLVAVTYPEAVREAKMLPYQINMQRHDLPLDLLVADVGVALVFLGNMKVDEEKKKLLFYLNTVFFFVLFSKGLSAMTSITVDFGDGTTISYVNISSIEDGVKHVYNKVGIYQVSATASNTLGSERVILYLHVSCK